MKRLPLWIIALLAALAGALTWIGYDRREEAGPLPFVLGLLWIAFVLASAGRAFSRDT